MLVAKGIAAVGAQEDYPSITRLLSGDPSVISEAVTGK